MVDGLKHNKDIDMNDRTAKILAEMIAHALEGKDVIPFFFQPLRGRSNHVSAAIRIALKTGALVQNGVDGTGAPKYAAPAPVATHRATSTVH